MCVCVFLVLCSVCPSLYLSPPLCVAVRLCLSLPSVSLLYLSHLYLPSIHSLLPAAGYNLWPHEFSRLWRSAAADTSRSVGRGLSNAYNFQRKPHRARPLEAVKSLTKQNAQKKRGLSTLTRGKIWSFSAQPCNGEQLTSPAPRGRSSLFCPKPGYEHVHLRGSVCVSLN